MRRAVFATALAGTTTACAVLAGLGEDYAAAPDAAASADVVPAGESSGDAGSDGAPADAPSTGDHYSVDAADADAAACGDFTCPDATFCDDFDGGLGAWTRFNAAVTATAQIDLTTGCKQPSLLETSASDDDLGVYQDFDAPNKLTLEVDLRIDTLGVTEEGDFFKVYVQGYDLRAHFANGALYVLEVGNNGNSSVAHAASFTLSAGLTWHHVLLQLDRHDKTCTLLVDTVVVSDDEALSLTPSTAGPMSAALSPRLRTKPGAPIAIHVDNVVIKAK